MIEEDAEKLDILQSKLDNAQLTEYMIQHANRYRLSHPEIEIVLVVHFWPIQPHIQIRWIITKWSGVHKEPRLAKA